jgi:hypothetical protein
MLPLDNNILINYNTSSLNNINNTNNTNNKLYDFNLLNMITHDNFIINSIKSIKNNLFDSPQDDSQQDDSQQDDSQQDDSQQDDSPMYNSPQDDSQ